MRMATTFLLALLAIMCTTTEGAKDDRFINITILQNVTAEGAVCLDGTPPAYHLDRGFDSGLSNWLIFIDGGGWCDTIPDCKERSNKPEGSSKKMDHKGMFAGILHNSSRYNPDFYNWNRVRVKYCDGSSLTGDVEQVDPENKLFFRGARVFKAIMEDLRRKGMKDAKNAILCGTSAGGLATILNCDKFKSFLPNNARVKCVADAGFFINGRTISGTLDIQDYYDRVVALHGSAKNLPPSCTSIMEPSLCFFPENVVPYMQTPLFIINSEYDAWQINNTLIPENLDPQGVWDDCKKNISNCTYSQRIIVQGFGLEFLKVLGGLAPSFTRGYFITSCHSHGHIRSPNCWFSATSPRLLYKTIAEAVADWFYDRAVCHQFLDPYPCARYCDV